MNGGCLSFVAALVAMMVPLLSVIGGEECPELPRRITDETDEARSECMVYIGLRAVNNENLK